MLYKGYVETKGKACIEKLKNRTSWKTLDQVKDRPGYGGVLANDTILVDLDDGEQAEILMNIVEDLQLNCKVLCTSRGKHFLFKNHTVTRNHTHVPLAVGLNADIKVGTKLSYEVLKLNGEERFCEWDVEDPSTPYDELPKWLVPVKASVDFLDMSAGDGRNQALFNYILTLTSYGFTKEECRECIRILNQYVLREPLSSEELEVVLRDEAFQKPVFFRETTFLFDKFANYMVTSEHVVRINQQLHIYRDGVYEYGYRYIEKKMIELIPNLKKSQRREVLDYMELIAPELSISDARYIAFANGVYDLVNNTLVPYSPDLVLTNRIPWDYVPTATCELAEHTLDKLACNDPSIVALLQECIGYCFFRQNELGKAFILTGDKSNGKSTFLDVLHKILGDENISALDLKELGDRFSTSMMFGKLANIGDDIGDDFLQGTQVSIFKKVVTGNRIKAERKGMDPFEFNPYVKLLFSANDIPRMKDKTGAVLRRLVIIPFNATFTDQDPDFDPHIKYKLAAQDSIEYLIRVGIDGLQRVLSKNHFTYSEKVSNELKEYEEENNPIAAFIQDQGENMIENELTSDVYKRYQVFCADNALTPMSNIVFSKQITKRLKLNIRQKKINGQVKKIFTKEIIL